MPLREGAARALPTPTTIPFWDAAAEGRLSVQRCDACRRHVFYPRLACPECGSRELRWVEVSGRATLSSYVINHLPAPGFEDASPYVIAIVRLEEGPTMMTNLVDVVAPDRLEIDMALEVAFEDRLGQVVPVFRPAIGTGA